jgi:hypothetical protein
MSIYWNDKLLKKMANDTKRKSKCRINTNVGRFYFYFEREKEGEPPLIHGRLIFFPNKD